MKRAAYDPRRIGQDDPAVPGLFSPLKAFPVGDNVVAVLLVCNCFLKEYQGDCG
jgi:hypothetical protein